MTISEEMKAQGPDVAEIAGRGLSKRIGATGFAVRRGAHHPWDYVLLYNDRPIAGLSADFFFPAVRAYLENSHD